MLERDAFEAGFESDVFDEFSGELDRIDGAELTSAVADYDQARVERTVFRPGMMALLLGVFSAIFLQAFGLAAQDAAGKIPGFHFNPLDDRYVGWLQQHTAEAVSSITDQARASLRGILIRGFRAGLSADQIAFEIKAGLFVLDRQSAAIETMGQRMRENGILESQVRARMGAAYRQALHYRANLIAATELTSAITAANLLVWEDAFRLGLTDKHRKRWVTVFDERTCPICKPLHNVTVDLNAVFPGGMDGPPAHPICRCHLELVGRTP